jgi:hypothetical protein
MQPLGLGHPELGAYSALVPLSTFLALSALWVLLNSVIVLFRDFIFTQASLMNPANGHLVYKWGILHSHGPRKFAFIHQIWHIYSYGLSQN